MQIGHVHLIYAIDVATHMLLHDPDTTAMLFFLFLLCCHSCLCNPVGSIKSSIDTFFMLADQLFRPLQVRCWFAGCMMSAALNMLLILTIGSGLSEGRHVDRYNDSARNTNVKGYNDGPTTGSGTTTVV